MGMINFGVAIYLFICGRGRSVGSPLFAPYFHPFSKFKVSTLRNSGHIQAELNLVHPELGPEVLWNSSLQDCTSKPTN